MAEGEVVAPPAAGVMTLPSSGPAVAAAGGSTIGGSLSDPSSPAAAFTVSAARMLIGSFVALSLRPARVVGSLV